MRARLVVVLAVILAFVTIGGTGCQASSGFVHTSGTQLLDGNGQPLLLHGIDVGDTLLWEQWMMDGGTQTTTGMSTMLSRLASVVGQPATDSFTSSFEQAMITQADVQQIAADGFNVLRVPFDARFLSQQLPMLDNIVGWAKSAGIYVVLDMHAAPCSQNPYFTSDSPDGTAGLWYVSGCKSQAIAAWHTVATRYADSTTVAAFDLLNEPDGFSMSNTALTSLYGQIISSIRSVDQNHAVMVEGRNFTHDASAFTGPLDPNLILELHQYVWDMQGPNIAPTVASTEAAAQRLGGVPVWVGEMGLDDAASTQLQVSTYNSDPRICGWAYWAWRQATQTGVKQSLDQYTAPDAWLPVINWMANKSGSTKPTVAQAQAGMAAELAAIPTATLNTSVLSVLEAGA